MFVPSFLLKQLYTRGSLKFVSGGIELSIKNRLKDAFIRQIIYVRVNGNRVPLEKVSAKIGSNKAITGTELNAMDGVDFPLRKIIHIRIAVPPDLSSDQRQLIGLAFEVPPFGKLRFEVDDFIVLGQTQDAGHIPRDDNNDFSEEIIQRRQDFYQQFTGKSPEHLNNYSIDPATLLGNIESFVGVAQVPIGIAGPLAVRGEHANGEFVVPLATTEGTLVASYNRGMKLLSMGGGVKVTVVDDAMQRAPVFVFEDARYARDFVEWIKDNFNLIATIADSTSSMVKLTYIDPYLSNKFAFLRFNYNTGDAAGQNMAGKATFAACSWILDRYKVHKIVDFYRESNFATDKKGSQINIMRTRGKRVIAEASIKREHLLQIMRVEPKQIDYHGRVASVGAFLSGANNTGLQSPNGIAAIFIATGQDAANVAESSAGILHRELTEQGDLYISLTIPSLIVGSYGGGTGLGTQRECLELMDCYGKDKVMKLAEIVGAVALAGEISMASAIASSDWVSVHDIYGQNKHSSLSVE